MKHLTTGLSLFFAAAGTVPAQFTLVNPASAATTEGTTRISFPYGQGQTDMRYQQILALSTTSTATGLIKQIAHRRDNDTLVASGAYAAWTPDLDVSLSTSPLAAAHMSPVFANNVGTDVKQVHSGVLNWPAQAKVPPGPTAFAYTIPVNPPFLYISINGDLTIDVQRKQSQANNNPLFLMDATSGAISNQPNTSSVIGAGCSTPAGNNAVLVYGNWIPGSNYARILLWKAANNSPAYWSIGTQPQLIPIDLTVIGAPGCRLYHNNLILIPGMTTAPVAPYIGRWEQVLQIPNDNNLANFTFYTQYALLNDQHIGNAIGLSVSDALSVTVGVFTPGVPAHSEAHASGLNPTTAGLVQQGYGMVTEIQY